ncbi:MAG: ribonuclease III [Candidatus Methylacidiphilales bacterium]
MPQMEDLEAKLQCRFQNETLLIQALTHPSCAYGDSTPLHDNQRLEFLGDAILQATLTHYLYQRYPNETEGFLTKLRAAAVNRSALEKIARQFDLGQYLTLGHGEEKNHGREKASNLADAMEAVIGALYLDSGYEATQAWIHRVFTAVIDDLTTSASVFNPKGALQEWLQAKGLPTPNYELVSESGPDHKKTFTVKAVSEGECIGLGSGSSKKWAEIAAAQDALDRSIKAGA